MRIALTLTPPTDLYFRWAAQIGVTDFVCRYPRTYGLEPIEGLTHMHRRAQSFGLRMSVVEGYLPIDHIIVGESGRDEQVAELCEFVRHMGTLGAEVLCYNWMPNYDWTRTSTNEVERGGALTNSFDVDALRDRQAPASRCITPQTLWENLAWFLERLTPVAKSAGIKLAMHPDDPPLPTLMGASQIMYDLACFDRLLKLIDDPTSGVCFCQGTFSEVGADIPAAIRRLASRIHYVHFRDVRGTVPRFVETFHDNGQTNMVEAMRAYKSINFQGPARPDHVPKLEGEKGDANGYTMLGRLFAVGYMRGLIQSVNDGKN